MLAAVWGIECDVIMVRMSASVQTLLDPWAMMLGGTPHGAGPMLPFGLSPQTQNGLSGTGGTNSRDHCVALAAMGECAAGLC